VPTFEDGDVIEGCNLSQPEAHTSLGSAKGLIFRDCNLCNCDVPEDATVENCLTIHVVSARNVVQRTDMAPLLRGQKSLAPDEVEVTETEVRTVECADGSVTEQVLTNADVVNAKGERVSGEKTQTDANIIVFPKVGK
jgi:hypothetical protein